MKTQTEFKAFFDTEIAPAIKSKMSEFRWVKSARKWAGLFVILGGVSFFVSKLSGGGDDSTAITIQASAASFAIFSLLLSSALAYYSQDFRETYFAATVGKILKFLGQFKYNDEIVINAQTLDISELIANPGQYYFSDKIEGYMGDTHIKCCSINVLFNTDATISAFWRKKERKSALFLFAGFNKDFKGKTLVFSDRRSSSFSHFADKILLDEYEKITLEDPDFNKHFSVYSYDGIEARYILSPNLMARMQKMQREVSDKICFSFIRSYIFISYPTDSSLYGAFMAGKQTYEDFEKIYHVLSSAFTIVEDLQLDRKIWG